MEILFTGRRLVRAFPLTRRCVKPVTLLRPFRPYTFSSQEKLLLPVVPAV